MNYPNLYNKHSSIDGSMVVTMTPDWVLDREGAEDVRRTVWMGDRPPDRSGGGLGDREGGRDSSGGRRGRSEEHTSELQSQR